MLNLDPKRNAKFAWLMTRIYLYSYVGELTFVFAFQSKFQLQANFLESTSSSGAIHSNGIYISQIGNNLHEDVQLYQNKLTLRD